MNPEELEEFDLIVVQGVRYRVKKELEIRNHLFAILLSEWEEEEFNREYPEIYKQLTIQLLTLEVMRL